MVPILSISLTLLDTTQNPNGFNAYTQSTYVEQHLLEFSITPTARYQSQDGDTELSAPITPFTSFSNKKRKTDDCDSADVRLSSSTMASDHQSTFSVPHSRSSTASYPTTARSSISSITTPWISNISSAPVTPYSNSEISETTKATVSTSSFSIYTGEEEPVKEGPYVCPGCNMGDSDSLPQRKSKGKVYQRKLMGTFVGKPGTWYEPHLKGYHSKIFKPDDDDGTFLCRLCRCTQVTQKRCGARFKDWDTLFEHVLRLHSQPMSDRSIHCHNCPPLVAHSLVWKFFER